MDERIAALCAELTNYERDRPDRPRFSLDAMHTLLARPSAPPRPDLLIQVGGSKGKGTTARYLETLARHAGLGPTGVYASPHAETVLERVRIDGANVDGALLYAQLESVLEFARSAQLTVSFFEVMTAAALGCFAAEGVRFGVLEVGLGGRLDATTAVPVDAGILTSVELEHTELLGTTVEAIAAEKAWVLRPGRPGFVALRGAALDVVRAHAEEVAADLSVLGADFAASVTASDRHSLSVAWTMADGAAGTTELLGAPLYEAQAFGLAVACLRRLVPGFEPPGRLARPVGPCCFEEVGGWVLDGAHTVESARLLGGELERRFGLGRRRVVFGTAVGKEWRGMLRALLAGCAGEVVCVAPPGTAGVDPAEVAAWIAAEVPGFAAHAVDWPGAEAALRPGGSATDDEAVRVVTGSFYLAGAARRALNAPS